VCANNRQEILKGGLMPETTSTSNLIAVKDYSPLIKVGGQKKQGDIIILGMGPSRNECPYDAEVYSCNTGYRQIAAAQGRLDRIFIVHKQVKDQVGDEVFDWNELNVLIAHGVEVYNIHKLPELNSLLYPKKLISLWFNTEYYSDTIAYMIAFALFQNTRWDSGKAYLKNPFHLRLYGVDMQEGGEYTYEKGGIEYWLGYLQGLGGTYSITETSTLLHTHNRKAYGEDDEVDMKLIDPDNLLEKEKELANQTNTTYKWEGGLAGIDNTTHKKTRKRKAKK
jgi:hypothetical protein